MLLLVSLLDYSAKTCCCWWVFWIIQQKHVVVGESSGSFNKTCCCWWVFWIIQQKHVVVGESSGSFNKNMLLLVSLLDHSTKTCCCLSASPHFRLLCGRSRQQRKSPLEPHSWLLSHHVTKYLKLFVDHFAETSKLSSGWTELHPDNA